MTANDRKLLNALLRQDLTAFTVRAFQTINPGAAYKHNWHIEAITHQLTQVANGASQRLLITQPPRSLKSICTSVAFVAWMLGRNPALKIMCVSYSNELAVELARQFRMVIESDWHRTLFPRMRAAKDTGLELVTTSGGGRFATSVSGTLTGRGADLVIIDDPLKAEDALSKVARDRVNNWYGGTLVSRLNDKGSGAVIIVMQRLHEEDLAGYVLAQGGWAHLDLPAVALERQVIALNEDEVHVREIGDVLHPDREGKPVLDQIKSEIGSFNFTAQYLQRPVPTDGNLIKWKWFQVYAYPPAHDSDGRVVQSWDTALKSGNDNDYSACSTWLVKGTAYYLLHLLRERLDYPALKRRVIEMSHRFAAHSVLIEDKGSGTSLYQDLLYTKSGVRPIPIQPDGDKVTRMGTHASLIEAGHVHLPEEANWLPAFKAEILAFPHGRFDDQVDSASQFLKWARERQLFRVRSGRAYGMI